MEIYCHCFLQARDESRGSDGDDDLCKKGMNISIEMGSCKNSASQICRYCGMKVEDSAKVKARGS